MLDVISGALGAFLLIMIVLMLKPDPLAKNLDLIIVMDTTGSMADEIEELKKSILSIVRVLDRVTMSLRIGFIAFRDHKNPDYLTKPFQIRDMDVEGQNKLQIFVEKLSWGNGFDIPESIGPALGEAMKMSLRNDAQKVLLLIGDAVAHDNDAVLQRVRDFHAGSEERIISTIYAFSKKRGRDAPTQEFFRRVAETGGGEFVSGASGMMEAVLLSVLN